MNLTDEQIKAYWRGQPINLPRAEQDKMRENLKNILIDGIPSADEWDDTTLELIRWLEQTQLPASFDMGDGQLVTDGALYRRYLLRALQSAPTAAAAQAAAHHLRTPHRMFGNTAVPETNIPQTA